MIVDRELIEDVKKDDIYAFERLVRTMESQIFSYCYRMLGSIPEAEEASEKIFIKVFNGIDTYKNNISFPSWVYRLAHSHCIKAVQNKRFLKFMPLHKTTKMLNGRKDSILGNEICDEMNRTLNILNPQNRSIFVLNEIFNCDYEEVGAILNKNSNYTKQSFEKSKKKLSKHLERMSRKGKNELIKSLEILEREFKFNDLPYINLAEKIVTRISCGKRKRIRTYKSTLKKAVIFAVALLIIASGIYKNNVKIKQEQKAQAFKVQKEKEQKKQKEQEERARLVAEQERQKQEEEAEKYRELHKYAAENESVIIGYTNSPSYTIHVVRGGELKNLKAAQKEINKVVKNFATLPKGYKFEYASMNYSWREPDEETKNKYINEAIKNKEEVFKIPLVRGDEVDFIYFGCLKETSESLIYLSKTYMKGKHIVFSPKISLSSVKPMETEEKLIIEDHEISIISSTHNKMASWHEINDDYSVSYSVNLPLKFEVEDIKKVILEIIG